MAARANMTDEAPVAFLKTSMSLLVFTRSREPPLQDRCGCRHSQEKNHSRFTVVTVKTCRLELSKVSVNNNNGLFILQESLSSKMYLIC